jgi:predicted transcriptional regulator
VLEAGGWSIFSNAITPARSSCTIVKDTVREIMTEKVYRVRPDDSIEECMALMTARHIRHLPVMVGEQLVGVVSIGDVVKEIIEEQGFVIEQLENYITGDRGSTA